MRYRTGVTAPAAALIGTAAVLAGGTTAYAIPKTDDAPAPETLGDPVFPNLGNDGWMMHELVHSYFGNSVSPATWTDLRLNEGHADFYGLLHRYERGWADSLGLTSFEARRKDTYARGDQWRRTSGPVAAPNAANLFDSRRYLGGVLVLYALRQLVGEDAFHEVERTFLARHRNSSASTEDYIAVASRTGGQDVSGFLRDWPYGTTTPRMPGHPDWTVTPVTPSLTAPRRQTVARWHENSATL